MATFSLKARDTRPILQVALKNPDGTAHDLTGSTGWKLHVKVNGSVWTRDMVKQGLDTAGILQYAWTSADWDAGNLPIPSTLYETYECEMEYEVIGGTSRMTFPNTSFDKLQISADLA